MLKQGVVSLIALFVSGHAVAGDASVVRHEPVEVASFYCPVATSTCADWLSVRRSVIGPMRGYFVKVTGNNATVVLTEPEGDRDSFHKLVRALFGDSLTTLETRRVATGYNGWLEDVIIQVDLTSAVETTSVFSGHTLTNWVAPLELVDRLRLLHMFSGSPIETFALENIQVIRNSPPTTSFASASLPDADRISINLSRVVGSSAKVWRSPASSTTRTFKEIASDSTLTLHRSIDNQLVAFGLPSQSNADAWRFEFEQFALASDFVLGAHKAEDGNTILIGRARRIPTTQLPPIRFETFQALIDSPAELSQSYERQRLLAGRLGDGGTLTGMDWAPIYLSSALEDTDYGTLLNLGDQILKSWSERGVIEYFAFSKVRPAAFPFGAESASGFYARTKQSRGLIYNWNTDGAFKESSGPTRTIVPSSYGALQVSYFPINGLNAPLERDSTGSQRGTRYFSSLGHPVLVRVSQHALLHSIAKAYIDPPSVLDTDRASPRVAAMRAKMALVAQAWINEIRQAGPSAGMTAIQDQRLEQLLRSIEIKKAGLGLSQSLADLIADSSSVERLFVRFVASGERLTRQQKAKAQEMKAAESRILRLRKARNNSIVARELIVEGRFCRTFSYSEKQMKIGPTTWDPTKGVCSYNSSQLTEKFEAAANLTYYFDKMKEFSEDDSRKALIANDADQKRKENSEISQLEKQADDLKTETEQLKSRAKQLSGLARELIATGELLSNAAPTSPYTNSAFEAAQTAVMSHSASGSIQTASIVGSRNAATPLAIGGHNLDSATEKFQPNAQSSQNLGATPPAQTLLDLMEAAALQPTPTQNLDTAMNAAGADAIAINEGSGVITFARRRPPPPIMTKVFGAAQLIDQMRGPPKLVNLHTEGLDPGTVLALAETVQQMETPKAQRNESWYAKIRANVAKLFERPSPQTAAVTAVPVRMVVVDSGPLAVSGEVSALSLLETNVAWNSAVVATLPTPNAGSVHSVTVRFPSADSPTLDVELRGMPANVSLDRTVFEQTIRTALPSQSATVQAGVTRIKQKLSGVNGLGLSSANVSYILRTSSQTLRMVDRSKDQDQHLANAK